MEFCKFVVLLLIFANVEGSPYTQVTLRCNDVKQGHWCCDNASFKYCSVTGSDFVVEDPNSIIYNVVDYNGNTLDATALEGLWISEATVKFIPRNLGKFFPNLVALWIEKSNLTSLEKEDLQQFYYLKYLHVRYNKISGLRGDTFQYNPKLAYMFLYTNNMKYIGKGLLSNMQSFANVEFTSCKDEKIIEKYSDKSNFDSFHGCNDETALIESPQNKVILRYKNINPDGWWCCNGVSFRYLDVTGSDLNIQTSEMLIDSIADRNGILTDTDSIHGLWIHETTMKYIPKNLGIFLPNLKGLWIENSNLLSIEKEDLKQFPNLKYLHIRHNNISGLRGDTFQNSPKLELVDMTTQGMKYIGRGLIDQMKNFKHVSFISCKDNKPFENYTDKANFDLVHGCNDETALISNSPVHVKLHYNEIADGFWCCNDVHLRYCSVSGNGLIVESSDTVVDSVVDKNGVVLADTSTIEGLKIQGGTVRYIPQNLGKLFPKLKGLWIEGSNLKSLEKEDLEQFPNLQYLHVLHNFLTALNGDVFQYNNKLAYMYFYSNNIQYFGHGLLEKLNSLKDIGFTSCKDSKTHSTYSDKTAFDSFHGCNDETALKESQNRRKGCIFDGFSLKQKQRLAEKISVSLKEILPSYSFEYEPKVKSKILEYLETKSIMAL